MNPAKLAEKLADMYNTARLGEAATMIHLFGIRYAKQLRTCGESPVAIAKRARISESYGTEINKGINLARYVVER